MKKLLWKLLGSLALVAVTASVQASGGGHPLDSAPNRVNSEAALQHGTIA
jgi:hypothetical protein